MIIPELTSAVKLGEEIQNAGKVEAARLQAMQAGEDIRALRVISPLTDALEVDGSCGLAIRDGTSQDWVVSALATYLGKSEHIKELDANDTVQVMSQTNDGQAGKMLEELSDFEEAYGGLGVIVVKNLRHMTATPADSRGNADLYEYLSDLAHETRRRPERRGDKRRPKVLGLGVVSKTTMGQLTGDELRVPNLGFTMELNDHFVRDRDVTRYFIGDASVALSGVRAANRRRWNGAFQTNTSTHTPDNCSDLEQPGRLFQRKRIGL